MECRHKHWPLTPPFLAHAQALLYFIYNLPINGCEYNTQTTQWGRDQETGAWRGKVTHLRPHSYQVAKQGFEPNSALVWRSAGLWIYYLYCEESFSLPSFLKEFLFPFQNPARVLLAQDTVLTQCSCKTCIYIPIKHSFWVLYLLCAINVLLGLLL